MTAARCRFRRPTLRAYLDHLVSHGCSGWAWCSERQMLDDADDRAVRLDISERATRLAAVGAA